MMRQSRLVLLSFVQDGCVRVMYVLNTDGTAVVVRKGVVASVALELGNVWYGSLCPAS